MYKVTIVGTENSHAINFAQLINGGHAQRNSLPVEDFRVCGIYGETNEAKKSSDEIVKLFPKIAIYDTIEEAVKNTDAVMVTSRHGGDHLQLAAKFIEAKIPAFIDKPFTITSHDAVRLRELARSNNVPICGGSCCGFVEGTEILANLWKSQKQNSIKKDGNNPAKIATVGKISAPVNMINDYGNFFFYSQHLVQIMCEIFGYYPKAISLKSHGDTADGYVKYADFSVDIHYTTDYTYKASIRCGDTVTEQEIDISKDGYSREVDTFCDMVRTGKMHREYSAQSAPVFILNAMQESMDADGIETACVFG